MPAIWCVFFFFFSSQQGTPALGRLCCQMEAANSYHQPWWRLTCHLSMFEFHLVLPWWSLGTHSTWLQKCQAAAKARTGVLSMWTFWRWTSGTDLMRKHEPFSLVLQGTWVQKGFLSYQVGKPVSQVKAVEIISASSPVFSLVKIQSQKPAGISSSSTFVSYVSVTHLPESSRCEPWSS